MDALATALEAHPLFARNSGSDFLLCLRHPNLKRLLGPKLKEVRWLLVDGFGVGVGLISFKRLNPEGSEIFRKEALS